MVEIESGLLRFEVGVVTLRDSGFAVGDPVEVAVEEDVVLDDS